MKTVAMLSKTRHRGTARVGWMFTLGVVVYNPVRKSKSDGGSRMRARGVSWLVGRISQSNFPAWGSGITESNADEVVESAFESSQSGFGLQR